MKFGRKVLLFFLLLTTLSSYSQLLEKRISIVAEDEYLIKVFKDIEKQEHINFSINSSLIPESHKVTVSIKDQKLAYVLDYLLKDLQIQYKEINSQVVLYKKKYDKTAVEAKSSNFKSVIKEEKIYVYDTIVTLTYDTITTLNFDTLIVIDTILLFDTVLVTQKIVPKSKYFMNVFYAPVFSLNLLNAKDDVSNTIPQHSTENNYSSSYGIELGRMFKRNAVSLGFGILDINETLSYTEKGIYNTSIIPTINTSTQMVVDTIASYFIYNDADTTWHYSIDTSYNEVYDTTYHAQIDTIRKEENKENKRRSLYFIIPVRYSYTFNLSKKINLGASLGVVYSYLLTQEISDGDNSPFQEKSSYSKHNLSLQLGCKLSYHIIENFSFYVFPAYTMSLNSIYSTNNLLHYSRSIIDMHIGFSFFF